MGWRIAYNRTGTAPFQLIRALGVREEGAVSVGSEDNGADHSVDSPFQFAKRAADRKGNLQVTREGREGYRNTLPFLVPFLAFLPVSLIE